MRYVGVAVLVVGCLPCATWGADWPQWQGPNRDSVSTETGLLQQWPDGGPTLAWRVEGLGGGDSAPAIVDGTLYGTSIRDGKEIVWARSATDGSEIWARPLGEAVSQRMPQSQEGPACTPSVDGDRLYVIGMGGTVACLQREDGEIVWRRSFTEDFGGSAPTWSYRESPLIDGDKLLCTPGGADALIVALDKTSGETLWETSAPGSAESTRQPERPERQPRNQPAERDDAGTTIAGTKDPELYASERWGMRSFTREVPNGRYTAKLHFAETYSGIRGEGGRVFSFALHGKEFEDFDVWKRAEGARRAYVESVEVEVTDGEFRIDFTRKVENPAIKAIELLPRGEGAKPIRVNAGSSTEFEDSKGNVWLADAGFEGGSVNANTLGGFGGFGGQRGGFGRPGGGFGRPGGGRGGRAGAAYSSIIAIDHDGRRQYVQLTSGTLLGVDAKDGEVLWQYDRPANAMGINCATPIYRDGLVFAASAYGNGGGAAKLVTRDDGTIAAEEVYFTSSMQNHHGGMVVVDGALYGANGGNGGGYITCLDFETGDILWRDRAAPKGSLVVADGHIYLRAEDGDVILMEPSRDGYVERGRFAQPDRSRSPAWARPVVANGKLYIRDQGLLLCYDVAEK